MRKHTIVLLIASALVAAVVSAPLLYAEESQTPSGSMRGYGTMKMMQQMGEMMDHCNHMMSNRRPNDQWRRNAPSALGNRS